MTAPRHNKLLPDAKSLMGKSSHMQFLYNPGSRGAFGGSMTCTMSQILSSLWVSKQICSAGVSTRTLAQGRYRFRRQVRVWARGVVQAEFVLSVSLLPAAVGSWPQV